MNMYSEKVYFPAQPEIELNTALYQEMKPIGSKYDNQIALFYQFKTTEHSIHSLSLIPDGCFDILFRCDDKQPDAILWTSPLQRRLQPNFHKNCIYFGIRFYPEQSLIKLNYPMKEMLDRQIPLTDVMTFDPSWIEMICTTPSFNERIKKFSAFLSRLEPITNNDSQIIISAVKNIAATSGLLNISELSRKIGYSDRYIRGKFEEYIGFSPKQFCQIVKFQNCLHNLLFEDDTDLLDLIYDYGYYDQAHFIRGFKKFAYFTPGQYKNQFNKGM
ncbi:helix-turn-helix domain-containing protein [Bacillus sp. T3]|uniref:helix-turn-helix domain-containing protein n=1 Tax=Bacillus sp. T3 TaxID=467262 RepID=UPI0029821B89|nr:helix-turn-helix domain-containing protein [Bacillus sp. T3]